MADVSLALNADIQQIATNGTLAVNDALDVSFIINNCTAFKVQGSVDGGSTYNDIAGSGSKLGTAGTLTTTVTYTLSFIRTRFDHLKVVYSGTNPVCSFIRRWIRQSPLTTLDRTKQLTIVDPVAGTA